MATLTAVPFRFAVAVRSFGTFQTFSVIEPARLSFGSIFTV